jgi:hypothetical protein
MMNWDRRSSFVIQHSSFPSLLRLEPAALVGYDQLTHY